MLFFLELHSRSPVYSRDLASFESICYYSLTEDILKFRALISSPNTWVGSIMIFLLITHSVYNLSVFLIKAIFDSGLLSFNPKLKAVMRLQNCIGDLNEYKFKYFSLLR